MRDRGRREMKLPKVVVGRFRPPKKRDIGGRREKFYGSVGKDGPAIRTGEGRNTDERVRERIRISDIREGRRAVWKVEVSTRGHGNRVTRGDSKRSRRNWRRAK